MKYAQNAKWFRPLFVQYQPDCYQLAGLELGGINFYDEEGVWLEVQSGWLEDDKNGDTLSITREKAPLRKLKKDFKVKADFILKEANRSYTNEKFNILYLYQPRSEAKLEKRIPDWENEEAKHYYDLWTIPLSYSAIHLEYHKDKDEFTRTEKEYDVIRVKTNFTREDTPSEEAFKAFLERTAKEMGVEKFSYDEQKVLRHIFKKNGGTNRK